jgi:nitroreductase
MRESTILEVLRRRRSIRQFAAQPIPAEVLDALLEAALRAPSSRGLRPWEFVVVTDPVTLKALATAKEHGAEFLAGAPLAIVVAADPRRCDVWVEDCAIAALCLQLAAVSLGLESCWAQMRLRRHADGRDAEAHVRELLDLPDHFAVDCIIGIGYPAEQKAGHPRATLPFDKIHRERFFSR